MGFGGRRLRLWCARDPKLLTRPFVARDLQVREAEYSEPNSMRAALTGVNRLLLVSSSDAG